MKNIKLYSLFLAVLLISACNAVSQKQTASVDEAIKALRKLDAATEVGLNKGKYSDLLIDAKTAVNQAQSNLSNSELKEELKASMTSYERAAIVWDTEDLDTLSTLMGNEELREKIVGIKDALRYSDKYKESEVVDKLKKPLMQTHWKEAKTHLEKATKLAE